MIPKGHLGSVPQSRGLPNVVAAVESKSQNILWPETSCESRRPEHRHKLVTLWELKDPLGEGELSNAVQSLADILCLGVSILEN